ncbi:peptidylprolyl isomerase [Candidatus Woesearchaeota archaeon]|nr:MAG: FKBP-type peptidyl-prolyl cis-trans isomerase SlyD [archaeon GW2011_AR4]MBS3130696.1 peptidylprolyl isomerase [Candidatus Woesearchaeota archaeon]HIH38841.1 peptidylprolyl isomerase [Candidatus Woesearchaeota archaeon]HIH48910.1 peptidylprolyl isomerase [Candidatus Woesearchaeota archaeon]HIJ04336.1 peptidylprolyl isomerase [Candidatus Woesearchaeota archaeon]
MAIKNGDFVEVAFTGMTKEEHVIFDTTDVAVAKQNGFFEQSATYKPRIICIGQSQINEGVDDALIGKEPGEETEADIPPEKGFGKKNPKLLQLVSTSIFKKEKIMPQVGLQVSIDGQMGIIKTVTGGRTIVDFNHPLSGKMLHYKIKPIRVVTGLTEKTKALLEGFRMPPESVSVDEEKNAAVKMKQELPNEFLEMIGKKIKELIPELKEVNFTS